MSTFTKLQTYNLQLYYINWNSFTDFFSKDLAEVYVTAYNSLKFITHRNGCFCIFAMK